MLRSRQLPLLGSRYAFATFGQVPTAQHLHLTNVHFARCVRRAVLALLHAIGDADASVAPARKLIVQAITALVECSLAGPRVVGLTLARLTHHTLGRRIGDSWGDGGCAVDAGSEEHAGHDEEVQNS